MDMLPSNPSRVSVQRAADYPERAFRGAKSAIVEWVSLNGYLLSFGNSSQVQTTGKR